MKRDGLTLGWGMAGCTWIAARFRCRGAVELRDDGTARVACGHAGHRHRHLHDSRPDRGREAGHPARQDRGRARRHILAGRPDLRRLDGDRLGGPRRLRGCRQAIASLLTVPPRRRARHSKGGSRRSWRFETGRCSPRRWRGSGDPVRRACSDRPMMHRSPATASRKGPSANRTAEVLDPFFRRHFVEVTWQPEIARLRVSRVVTVIDAGRILNPLAGRNQIEGAVVMGIGMALFEETAYDPQNGAPINASLADYVVAVNADVPTLDVHFLDYPDRSSTRSAPAASARSASPASPPRSPTRSITQPAFACASCR